MAAIKRSADVVWEGTIARGGGRLSGGSGAFAALPVTAASRFGEPEGKTTPEELIAAAHATCFTMALGSILAGEHTPPERLAVNAVVTLEEVEGKYTITTPGGIRACSAGGGASLSCLTRALGKCGDPFPKPPRRERAGVELAQRTNEAQTAVNLKRANAGVEADLPPSTSEPRGRFAKSRPG